MEVGWMGWAEGWMGIASVEVVELVVQVGSQIAFVGLGVVPFEKSKFD